MKKNDCKNQETSAGRDAYFWEKIRPATLQKCMLVITVLLACLPLFASLTVRLWMAATCGIGAIELCSYVGMGEYWHSLVYLLGLAMSAVALLFAAQRYKGKSLRICREKTWISVHFLAICMFFLLLWSVFSFLSAKDKQSGLWGDIYCHEGLILYFFYGAFFLTGSWMNDKNRRIFVEILTAVCALTGILVITKGKLIPGLFYLEEDIRTVMFHQYNHYGYFLAICTSLAMGLFLQDEKRTGIMKLLRISELWLIFNAVAVNSVRGSFLAILVVLICVHFVIMKLHREKMKKLLLMDALFFGTILFLNTGSGLVQRLVILVKDFLNISDTSDKLNAMDRVGSGRGKIWRYGIKFAMEKPIFGYGPANLQESYGATDCGTSSPHSDIVLIAASLGFPALTLYLVGLLGHVIGFLKKIPEMSLLEITMFMGMGGYFVSSLVGVSMYYTAPYYFLLLGFTYGTYKSYCQKTDGKT